MAASPKKLPLQTSNNVNVVPIAPSSQRKTIEQTYQKKSQLEHILLRPDTYIGSIEKHTQTLWVYENDGMVHRSVSYVPGLYKIFDEILVNAADNKQRDPKMDSLKVVIDVDQNLISVFNNGDGVPVEIHQEEMVYVPELIFGHLLTSSNYDDSVKKTTGGRNGYGAKLSNIFSTEFIIETADGKRRRKYKQVFSNNMGKRSDAVITKCKEGENWTKVSFKPDLAKFNMTHLEDDVVALMKRRVVDMAGCLGKTVKVELNGSRAPVKTFGEYVGLYLSSASKSNAESPLPRIEETVNDRWDICVSLSEGQFQQVSFVNSIATTKGGTHVDCVANQIANHVVNIVNKKNKNANIKAHNVKNHLWVFVNALIDNPAFDSQTKETLTLRQSSFGSKCELSDKFLQRVAKSGIVETLLSWADFKHTKDLKKTDGSKKVVLRGIPKLDDAPDAGGRDADKCTLILTEGDSAKALAVAGKSVLAQGRYGVFPLRGKPLNVRDARHDEIMKNQEFQHVKQILGLQQGKEYDSVKSLRYGCLMIMTDQDHDGSHIKGLLINMFHTFWPSLLKIPSFLVEFITPIVKATHKDGTVLSFYTMPEYESWKESLAGNASAWSIKYYKGLGTSTSKEGKEYFKAIDKHMKEFVWKGEQDGEAIELAFCKKNVEGRKTWLRQFKPGTYLDHKAKHIRYSDFINKELILFSLADLQRNIPSVVDGLKPCQRKVLFCAFKRNFVKEAKIAQFAGYVSEHSAYHHGEQSLTKTIIGMAQDYVGFRSNNINLLVPSGQFGTRQAKGKDFASARYIYTRLSPITRFLFPKEDDSLLDYRNEDGLSIEPNWYMPIIPTVLVNGGEGIGTGWSSDVPKYNPRDIINNVRHLLNGEMMEPMDPWYKGFKGTIEKTAIKEGGVTYTVSGIIDEVGETSVRITELPLQMGTDEYHKFLQSKREEGDREKHIAKDQFIKDYSHDCDDVSVDFSVELSEENMMIARKEGLLKKFKLTDSISTSNMHLFDSKGEIKKYDSPEQILEEFFHLRLEYYEKRKKALLDNIELELSKLDNKVRFILGVVNGEIIVSNRKRAELFMELRDKGFTPFPKKAKNVEAAVVGAADDSEESEETFEALGSRGVRACDYEYLLSMSIGTLTLEKVQELCAERDKLLYEVDILRKATPKQLWLKDLAALEHEIDEQEKHDAEAEKARNNAKDARKSAREAEKRAGGKPPKQAPKRASKSVKKVTTTEAVQEKPEMDTVTAMETDSAPVVAKAKGKAGGATGKAAAVTKSKKDAVVVDDDDDDEVLELKERLAAYNLDSSPENFTAMQTEACQAPARKKDPSKRAADVWKEAVAVLSESSEEDDSVDVSSDHDFDQEVKQPEAVKKGGRKPAAGKPVAAPRKRAAASKQPRTLGQKLLTGRWKPAESTGISPEKKVRNMHARKKDPSKRAADVRKEPVAALSESSEKDDSVDVSSDHDFDQEVKQPEAVKKGGRKPAAGKSVAAPRKRAAASKQPWTLGQKLLTDRWKPAESMGISPEKKVRKMRASPFNKKSSSILGNPGEEDVISVEEKTGSEDTAEVAAPAGARPTRATRTQKSYVLSESESDEASQDSNDSDSDEASEDVYEVSDFSEDD